MALSMVAMTGLSGAAQAADITEGQVGDVEPVAASHGCPYGAVCVYPDESWNDGNPTYVFYSYGAHKIYNQYGWHRVFNNQYGRAFAASCKQGNGTDCHFPIMPGTYSNQSLTLVDSILLFTDQ